ncbi:MAG: DegV family protein, partial [Lachnospiraceae bacterium]|nr:DegV family protein [Lachnospiraceae bacterium]
NRYIHKGGNVVTSSAGVDAYTAFFSQHLRNADHIIHIAISPGLSRDYTMAEEAARAFDNVTVFNSERVTSATGLLILIAGKLVGQGYSVEEIIEELDAVKDRISCNFYIDNIDFMARRRDQYFDPARRKKEENKNLSYYKGPSYLKKIHGLIKTLNLHLGIRIRNNRANLSGIWIGNDRAAYKQFIRSVIPFDIIPDKEVLFITYSDIPVDTLLWIKEEISKVAGFERIIFNQMSAVISTNCGSGSFAISYLLKGNKNYNIGTFFDEEGIGSDIDENDKHYEKNENIENNENNEEETVNDGDQSLLISDEEESSQEKELKWYEKPEFIDGAAGVKNSGSEEAFRTVLKIFHDSIQIKAGEIDGFYKEGDWDNYTVKVHALKSSARLIGALSLADRAQLLENAGKEGNINYIRENQTSFMDDYRKYESLLAGIISDDNADDEDKPVKPMAEDYIMEGAYESLKDAASDMDCDMIEEVFKELDGYEIPAGEKDKISKLRERAGVFDYNGILEILNALEES